METKDIIERLKKLLEYADERKPSKDTISVFIDDSFYETINATIEKLEGID